MEIGAPPYHPEAGRAGQGRRDSIRGGTSRLDQGRWDGDLPDEGPSAMIVIIGAGLAGLSTALHLADREHIVLEREPEAGGLCRSRRVGEFVFDYTGHLLHLRDPEIVGLVDRLLPGAFEQIERRAAIRSHGKLLPYPFQANTYGLPPEVVFECVHGFWKSLRDRGSGPAGPAE